MPRFHVGVACLCAEDASQQGSRSDQLVSGAAILTDVQLARRAKSITAQIIHSGVTLRSQHGMGGTVSGVDWQPT